MRFLYACDIHGDKNKYSKLLEVAVNEKIKYMVWGGDLLPKRGGPRETIQPEFIDNYLDDYFGKLKENNIECIFIMGNDDLENFDDKIENLCKKHSNIHNIDRSKFEIDGISFIGLSNVLDNPFRYKNRVLMEDGLEMEEQLSPEIYINKGTNIITVEEWRKYRETSVDKMKDVLASLPKISDKKNTIFVFHAPPYGIGLDECQVGYKAGSKDMANYIKNSGAYMSLHGHIHESPDVSGVWESKLGDTICIQPGQTELGEEKMMYMIIDTEKNKRERFLSKLDL